MKKLILSTIISSITSSFMLAQNVGIGTTTPLVRLHVADSNVVFTAAATLPGSPTLAFSGTGNRFMWVANKAALRAGGISGTGWDVGNIGTYSIAVGSDDKAAGNASGAFGNGNTANGQYSMALGSFNLAAGFSSIAMGSLSSANDMYDVAIGYNAQSTGQYCTSIGYGTISSNSYSTAIGYQATANNLNSISMGQSTTASGGSATAIGVLSTASGDYSMALGQSNTSSGTASFAFGTNCVASGVGSTAFGYAANTNSHFYSFCISGNTTTGPQNTADHQMMMDFPGGYYFWTGPTGQGVHMDPSSNSWLSNCDYRKKENFEPVDGETVLQKLSGISFTSWNYKGGNVKHERHYGIMAQDFHNAFGYDNYGTIGNDTTVNPIDMIGIAYSAIQSLEQRTKKIDALEKENAELHRLINELANEVSALKKRKMKKPE